MRIQFEEENSDTISRPYITLTFSVRSMERNFFLSPTSIALLMIATSSLTESSIGTGGMFSPPAVIIISAKENEFLHKQTNKQTTNNKQG